MNRKSTITLHKSDGRVFFRTAIPYSIAVTYLGLTTDVTKQQIKWSVQDGKLIVERTKK